jgi:predicted nucleic acid-binding protein
MQTIEDKIVSRIYGRGRGWAFGANDFSAEFGRSTIDWALSRLVASGTIRRVCRGVYDYPKFSALLQQELSPDFDQVAQAFARKFNWRIQPAGDAALNLLGISTQVPGRLVYLSDGPNRQYDIGLYTLEFKKSALKDVGFKYRESGLIVQALKALGRERVDDAVIAAIRKQLDDTACKRVLKDTVTATGWVYETIKRICGAHG